jgi:hypothetical protein
LALGAAFLREARFSFLRSSLSVTFLVFATEKSSFHQASCETRKFHVNKCEESGGPGVMMEACGKVGPLAKAAYRVEMRQGPMATLR